MSHLTTFGGKRIDPLSIDPAQFDIVDIAHALARVVRYNGHQERQYTVGMHSIACATLIDSDSLRFEALMHDASEAYLCDIPTPIKMLLPDYQQMEKRMEAALRDHFALPATMSDAVRVVDHQMLIAEVSVLHPALWRELGSPQPSKDAVALVNNFAHYGPLNTSALFLTMAGAQ